MTTPNHPDRAAQHPRAAGWASAPQPSRQQAPPMPIPSPNGKPYFRSGGWLEVLSIAAMVLGVLMIAFGVIELLNGTPGSGMATALGLVVVVLGGILAAVLRLGSMLESRIAQRR